MFKNLPKINFVLKRQAGHSKWANIKHTKELKDKERCNLFTKIGHRIKVAIQEGGSSDPGANIKLGQIVKQAKGMNMPVATINNIIKSTQKDKNKLKTYVVDIKGPGKSFIICELISPNIVKTKNAISTIMKKHMCKYSDSNIGHLFEHKGFVETELPSSENKSKEEIIETATNDAIECEAEEVELLEDANILSFLCNPQNFHRVQQKLEQLNYTIKNSYLYYVPITTVTLPETEYKACTSFLTKLEEMDDIVGIYHNLS